MAAPSALISSALCGKSPRDSVGEWGGAALLSARLRLSEALPFAAVARAAPP